MNGPEPSFSVVVPTYNRPQRLASLLDSLADLRYPTERWELILVDDGGRSPLDRLVAPYQRRFRLSLLKQQNTGPAGARNHGAEKAGGEFLAFIDDDSQADPYWLDGLATVLREAPNALCGGRIVNSLVRNPYAEASQLLLDYLYESYRPGERLGAFFPTNNLAVSRELFRRLCGFDRALRFAEDREFCYRWALSGRPFAFAPEAVVRHAHDLDWFSFLKLHFSYGGGTCQFRQICRARGGPDPGVSSPRWYIDLVLSGLVKRGGLRGATLTALLAAAQGAMGTGVFWNTLRSVHRPVAARRSAAAVPASLTPLSGAGSADVPRASACRPDTHVESPVGTNADAAR